MLAGPGGVGKTMFELQVALAVACGGSICGGLFEGAEADVMLSTQPGRVVMVVAEETVEVIWHRLHAVVATLHRQHDLLGVDVDPPTLLSLWEKNLRIYPLAGMPRVTLMHRDLLPTERFTQLLAASEEARLVMLDPIRRLHASDENDSGSMTALVQMLQEITSCTNAALIFAHHTNRASTQLGTGDTAGAARGSTALSDGVRWQLNLSRPTRNVAGRYATANTDSSRFVMADIAKSNYLPPQPTVFLERIAGGVLMRADKVSQFANASTNKQRPRKHKSKVEGIPA